MTTVDVFCVNPKCDYMFEDIDDSSWDVFVCPGCGVRQRIEDDWIWNGEDEAHCSYMVHEK